MDEHTFLTFLLEDTFTKPSLTRRLRLLREFAELSSYTKLGSSLSEYLSLQNIGDEEALILTKWHDEATKVAGEKPLVFAMKQFEGACETIPTITVYLPTQPDEVLLKRIANWFRENLEPTILLEIIVKPELVTGCAFVHKGTYHDFSLNYFFTKHHDQIKGVIDEYTRA